MRNNSQANFLTIVALSIAVIPAAFGQNPQMLKAAEMGDAVAQVQMGYAFRDGRGVTKNDKEAYAWFSKAANAGNLEGIDNLGWMLEHGTGTPRDEAKARDCYRKAAEKNHSVAQLNLARCLRDGIGGAPDPQGSLHWNISAFRLMRDGHTGSELLKQLLATGSLRTNQPLLAELAAVTSAQVQLKLAHVYHEGSGGIAKDPAKVAACFAKARANGMPDELLDTVQLDALTTRSKVKGEFAYLPTRHLDQGYNMCAPTSAAMGLEYYLHKPLDPYAIKKESKGQSEPGTGTAWDCMILGIKAVSGHDWAFRSWPNNNAGFDAGLPILLGELDAGRIALIDIGPHTVVLVGYDAKQQRVYIQNPAYDWPGIHTVSYDDLRKKWHSPWHVTTTKGIEARPVLLTTDSAMKTRNGHDGPH